MGRFFFFPFFLLHLLANPISSTDTEDHHNFTYHNHYRMPANSAIAMQLDYIRSQIAKIPVLKKYANLLEEKTKVNYEYFATAVLFILVVMLFSGFGAEIVVHLFAFVYPFIATVRCMESGTKKGDSTQDNTDWLMYWVVYGFLGVLDRFADHILYWIPFFSPLKLAFLVWCWAPNTKGANVIYKNIIQPIFNKHESEIDAALNSIDAKGVIDAAVAAASSAATSASATINSATSSTAAATK